MTQYWQLYLTRSITGVSIGGSLPLIFSMIGDMFNQEQRGKAISFISIMLSAGIAVGQSLAGLIGPANAWGWRAPFAVVAVPVFILAPIFLFTTKDPVRGAQDIEPGGGTYDEKFDWSKFKILLKNKTAILIFLQGIPGSLPWGVMLTYFQDFLVQNIGPLVGGITTQQSTVVVLGFGVGSGIGVVLGGIFADILWKKKYEYVPLFMSSTTLLGAFPIYALVDGPPQHYLIYALICLPAGILASMTGTAVKAVLL